jgi:hypothetical protein
MATGSNDLTGNGVGGERLRFPIIGKPMTLRPPARRDGSLSVILIFSYLI